MLKTTTQNKNFKIFPNIKKQPKQIGRRISHVLGEKDIIKMPIFPN